MNRAPRLALVLFLAIYGVVTLRTPDEFRLLDNLDLAMHETGHLVFAPFGEFMTVLGGTLLQLMVPAVFVASFWRRGDRFAALVTLWWVAQNCWNIARYIADAQAQVLPLVGGGEHDWTYLLDALGLLPQDRVIASTVRGVGALLFVIAVAGAFVVLPPTEASPKLHDHGAD
jgi:hypothetical protein